MKSNRVFFDIGHGLDTFPPSKGVYLPNGDKFEEHDFNSAVAIEAKKLAEGNGFKVVFSQQPYSKEIFLRDRGSFIKSEHKKDPFLCLISFHANASGNEKANGYGVFYWHTSTKGRRLAEIWNKYANEILDINQWGNGVWKSTPGNWTSFYILRETSMPAILPEHFFYTNLDELEKCNTKEFIIRAAEVTVKTLCEYVGKEYKSMYVEEEKKQDISPWAVDGYNFVTENNISDGKRPGDNVTREELWTMLNRMKNDK